MDLMYKLRRATTSDRFQLTTDGLGSYLAAVDEMLGDRVDFAQLVKTYRLPQEPERRSQLLLTAWLSSPIRALAAIVMASLMTVLLWQYQPFAYAVRDPFWRWPVLILTLSSAALVTYPLEYAWKKLDSRRKRTASQKAVSLRLEKLTPAEQHVLRQYLQTESTVAMWNRAGGVVDALAQDGVLYLLVRDDFLDVYRINDVAWEKLNARPELVGLQKKEPPTLPKQG